MKRIIIVEGVDGVGKSSFAKFLAKSLGYEYRHLNYKDDNSYEAYVARLREISKGDGIIDTISNSKLGGFVYDRFLFSEIAYSEVLGRKRKFDDMEAVNLFNLVNMVSEIFYIRHSNLKEVERRLKERGEDFLPLEKVQPVQEAFDRIFKDVRHSTIEFNMHYPFNEADVMNSLKPGCV